MIDELKQLYEKSTQGEWEYAPAIEFLKARIYSPQQRESIIQSHYNADAAFIAFAHNAMPELLELAELGLAFKKRRQETLKMLFDERE